MSFTNYAAQATLDAFFGKTGNFGTLSAAPTIYVALTTTAPAEDGTNITEPTGGGYARVATTSADWGTATLADPSELSNANDIAFPQATGNWGAISNFALFDAATGGNCVAFGQIVDSGGTPVTKNPSDGDAPKFGAGNLKARLD